MNRRKFVLSASASLALVGNNALAQRSRSTSSALTSELTGGEIDISGTSLELNNQHIEEADGSEHVHFAVPDGGQFDIIFWPQASGDPAEFVQMQVDMFASVLGEVEQIATDTYEDGGWIAFDIGNIGYYEYQLDAYPGHDLVVFFNAPQEAFADTLGQAQAVLIDGMPPFLFTEESDVIALAASRVSTTTSSSSRSSRSSRGTSTSETEETNTRSSRSDRGTSTTETEETNTRSSRSDRGESEQTGGNRTSSTTSGGDPVAAVRSHRDTFLYSYDDFYALLQTAADESTPSSELEQAFTDMVTIAREWQQYPTEAAKIQFGPEHADLEATYLEWADLVSDLGYEFEDFYQNIGSVDAFLDAYDRWQVVDSELQSLLRNLGHRFQRRAKSRSTIARGLGSVRLQM